MFLKVNLYINFHKLFSYFVNSGRKEKQASLSAVAVMPVTFELKIMSALFLIEGINSKANKRANSYFV